MKKSFIRDTSTLLLTSLMLISSLPLSSIKVGYSQSNMTFTSGETINFSSTTEMTFRSTTSFKFGTNITIQFFDMPIPGDGIIQPCDTLEIVWAWPPGFIPPICSWWEVIDPITGKLLGEFHVDDIYDPMHFHVDIVWPGPIMYTPGAPLIARMKVAIIQPCEYYVVHEPSHWWMEPCTWWYIIDPETGRTGYCFHVDWTNESCEFHIDSMRPGPYTLGFPSYEVEAIASIAKIELCDWFEILDPLGFVPDPCSWWEILDPSGAPTGLEFHVDDSGTGTFHVDTVNPDPLIIPWAPTETIRARKKIDEIHVCSWFRVTDPARTPELCSWWKVIYPEVANDVEFHVDWSEPIGDFHVDNVVPQFPFPAVYEVIAERKIDDIAQCDWFKPIDPPGFMPESCSWWSIVSPQEWAGVKFHVDSDDGTRFHVDQVIGQIPPITPWPYTVTAEPYTPPDPWYWKPAYPDYVPSGMPDFDQRQWGTYIWQDQWQIWSHCGPVSVANSLWWLDSEFEPNPIPPPIINDGFLLVQAYGQWDDHDPQNVPWLVEHLAYLMDTDGMRTGLAHSATYVSDMQAGLSHYLSWSGVNPQGDVNGDGKVDPIDFDIVTAAMGSIPGDPNWNLSADIFPASTTYPPFADNIVDPNDLLLVEMNMGRIGRFYEHTVDQPDFYYIEEEVERCQDVVLLLGYWIFDEQTGGWYRENGHYVTVAGVNSQDLKIAISDPMEDAFENGLIPEGRVPVPHVHPPAEPPYIAHNDAAFVSHDIYNVATVSPPFPPCPGGNWMLVNYVNWQPVPPFFTVIEAAVITSPYEDVHDIAVVNVTARTIINRGDPTPRANVNVTVRNEGTVIQSFNVSVYAHNLTHSIEIAKHPVFDLPPGPDSFFDVFWNTTGWRVGNYNLSAYAWPVDGEEDLLDNERYMTDQVVLKLLGDLGGGLPPQYLLFDKKCDGTDLALFINTYKGLAGSNWWLGDLGGPVGVIPKFFAYDGMVNAYDLALFIQCYKGLGP